MSLLDMRFSVEDFLTLKGRLCDDRNWDAYLDLFADDCVFHIPQWNGDLELTSDPERHMSLIYYSQRTGLEDRVFRLRTGQAASANPLPRTVHLVTNVSVSPMGEGLVAARANWVTHYVREGDQGVFFGTVDYVLAPVGPTWLIRRKHVVLMNDKINQVLDFYHV